MKIIVDENVIFAKEAFGFFGDVSLVDGRNITHNLIKDADILIIRSVTNITKELINNTNLKFIGTATIGVDHIDFDAIKQNNIYFSDAKGCNSFAVAEYVLTAILAIADKHNLNLDGKTIGIIGYGNVGKKVKVLADAIGLIPIVNDPPLQDANFNYPFKSLNEALSCDIVTFHVPLIKDGIYKTVGLLNQDNIYQIKKDTIIINTSRGAVINNHVLLNKINTHNNLTVLDVWENEPNCLMDLVNKTEIATAHIAGYSYEGKVIGTKIIYDALCNFLNVNPIWQPPIFNNIVKTYNYNNSQTLKQNLTQITKDIYDIYQDTSNFKHQMNLPHPAKQFDLIRKYYPLRSEFPNFAIVGCEKIEERNKLNKMRFN